VPKTKPTWQQATALVSLSTCGAMTGFAFAHGTVDEMTSPARMPVKLMAVNKPAKPATPEQTGDSALRSAVVKVAKNYLRMAQSKSPAEMEALIWGVDSVDGADHGESCAAFASLTLALGAQATGQQSWVTGGTTYPWPLRQWADVRVDLNPGSPQIISIMQDAQAHHRWHPLGDGYRPRPGDWAMFDGHVEVVTSYSARALRTIGGDSSPNLSVNAHTFTGSLAAQGVTGFVNNGQLLSAVTSGSGSSDSSQAGGSADAETAGIVAQGQAGAGDAAVPGTAMASVSSHAAWQGAGQGAAATEGTTRMMGTAGRAGGPGTQGMVQMPGMMADFGTMPSTTGSGAGGAPGTAGGTPATGQSASRATTGSQARQASQPRQPSKARSTSQARGAKGSGNARRNEAKPRGGTASGGGNQAAKGQRTGTAAIPGLVAPSAQAPGRSSSPAAPSYTRNAPPAESIHVPGTAAQQAFISQVAPGAIAMQSRYGIPAAVTIAQAIDESGWGQSALAIRDHNLFGIKGTGPAGADMLPTQEYQNGQYVTITAPFRVYHNVAESIADHGKLLATNSSYQHAMADRHLPDSFATDLTGVYATDPNYGSNLIAIMRLYNLYQFSVPASAPAQHAPAQQAAAGASAPSASSASAASSASEGGGDQEETAGPTGAVGQSGTYDLGGIVDVGGSAGYGGSASQASGSTSRAHAAGPGGAATIPGVLDAYQTGPARPGAAAAAVAFATPLAAAPLARPRRASRPAARVATREARPTRYVPQIPRVVTTAFVSTAKEPLSRAEPLYDDVARRSGIRWQLLAACDWMQCQARPRYSPVYGEKLGTVNAGGSVYRTKSEALGQCASDLVDLAMAVYWIDITARRPLSVGDLAKVFAAFRWGGLLKLHGISAMEFPYSVAGLSEQYVKMRWPDINDPNAPDKPGTRFRPPFGAVSAALCLGYPALA
jgi:flagellum-specific peptidoglycan hydrolase FlgJ